MFNHLIVKPVEDIYQAEIEAYDEVGVRWTIKGTPHGDLLKAIKLALNNFDDYDNWHKLGTPHED